MNRKNLGSFCNTTGTSFYNNTIRASVNELIEVIGEPCSQSKNDGQDKVNFEWNCEPDDDDVFTIYDWKEYRILSTDEQIEWHIGGKSKFHTSTMADGVEHLLDNLRLYKR